MADGKKTFIIEINGIQESLNAVESLNKQLDALEKRINSLSSKAVNVSTGSNGTGNKSSVSALSEEEKLTRQILQLDEKREVYQQQLYQSYLASKDLLKETLQDQKQLAASERLTADQYTNTMAGMKQQLADIKAVMQTVDLSDTGQFDKLTQKANELTNKLKEIEESYGQYGRNVGNYANGVAEGLQKVSIQVGDITREFANAREASRTLNNELKSMALNGQQNTEEYKDLNDAVKQMNSTLKDVEVSSVAMDNLLDTMQGIVAVASTAKGIGSLFGLDEGAIEQTIQKLVALQNVLQGLEVIRKQMQTQEGIGLLLSKGNKAVDKMVASIIGIGTASKGATIATKALSTALKGIGIGLAIAGVVALISYLDKYVKKTEEAKKAAEEFGKEQDKAATKTHMTKVEMENTLQTLMTFNGTKEEEKKIVEDLNSKYGKAIGNYKTLSEWKTALINKTSAYAEVLGLEAKMAAAASLAQKHYQEQMEAQRKGDMKTASGASIYAEYYENQMYDIQKEINRINRKYKINSFAPSDDDNRKTKTKIRESGNKAAEAMKEAQNNINDLKLKLMKEGLRKELAQLDEENRKEIEKIRKNGQKVEEQLKLQRQNYYRGRQKIFEEFRRETDEIISQNRISETNTQIKELENELDKLKKSIDITFNKPVGTMDSLEEDLARFGSSVEEYQRFVKYMGEIAEERRKKYGNSFINKSGQSDKDNILPSPDEINEAGKEASAELENVFNQLKVKVGKKYAELFRVYSKYGDMLDMLFDGGKKEYGVRLNTSFQTRTEITRNALIKLYDIYRDYYNKRGELQKKNIDEEEKKEKDELDKKISNLKKENERILEENKKIIEKLNPDGNVSTVNDEYLTNDEVYRANLERIEAYEKEKNGIIRKYEAERVSIENSKNEELSRLNDEWFSQRLKDYNEYLTKLGDTMSTQPVTGKTGFINISATKKNLKEAEDLIKEMRNGVINDMALVQDQFSQGLISSEDKNRIISNLNEILDEFDFATGNIKEKYKKLLPELAKQINEVFQIIGQAATSIIQSIGEINQAAFEKQLEAIEKQTDELEKQLDKQRELTEKYKDDVDSIEDELATARGDRRQHLIDQLNAQMQAQRESLAQEKRMEKEREKLDKKREKLEYDNEMRKWNQSKLTAAINTALAISSAAVNSWPIPAIPMIVAATTMGAAQMAAIIANKPRKYADGGLLEGRSHKQGGIPVGNTGIEVEGKEYIINKRTTMQNVDVLNFVNSKKRKLTIDDFIDFYTKGSKVSRNVSSMRARFEDGGQLPTIRTDIELNSRLIDTMERYAERPSVVQVVDIINKTDEVKRVQTLAGLS